jgi:hypothetical protein
MIGVTSTSEAPSSMRNMLFDASHPTHRLHAIRRSLNVMVRGWREFFIGLVGIAVVVQLGGIWHELHQMRNEQVRSALYSLPPARQQQLRGSRAERMLRSTTHVDGEVSIDDAAQPIKVEIDQ